MSTTLDQEQSSTTAAEKSDGDVVVFDGHCRLCQAQVKRLKRLDWGGRLSYLPLQSSEVQDRWPGISDERLHREMCVVDPEGERHWGPHAVRYLSRRLPTLWWLAPLMHIPGSMILWRPLYHTIARNRYKIWGRTEECDDGSCSIHRG